MSAEDFADQFGRPPAGAWAAPGRVNLIGEHTDYNDGLVLPIAVQYRTVAYASPRSDGVLNLRSVQHPDEPATATTAELEPGSVSGWAAYPAGVAWALREAGHRVGGADVLVDGNVPLGAGLSSSAALECAVGLALTELCEIDVERGALARLAQRAENDFVGVPCGIMDQTASLLAEAGRALLLDTRSRKVRQIPFDLAGSGLALLVVDTRAPHRLTGGEYAARRRDCEQAAALLGVSALRDIDAEDLDRALKRIGASCGAPSGPASGSSSGTGAGAADRLGRRVRHIVTENRRVLEVVRHLDAQPSGAERASAPDRVDEARPSSPGREHGSRPDWAAIGRLFTASHRSLRDDFEVSSPELDLAVDTALAVGALGARMTGGGFGGCTIALVPIGGAGAVATAVAEAFGRHGFNRPDHFLAEASEGAAKIFTYQ